MRRRPITQMPRRRSGPGERVLYWGAAVAASLLLLPLTLGAQARVETLVLSPEPGERVDQNAVLVAASFIDRDARLEPASIVLQVDGLNVTAEADVSAEVVTWIPRIPLLPGPHRVTLTARDRSGGAISPSNWAFTVTPAAEAAAAAAQLAPAGGAPLWTRLHGSLIFDGAATSVSGPGADLRRDETVLPRMWLNAGGILGAGWRYSARVHVSGYEDATRQPVNRYRLDIRSDWLSLAIGDVNPMVHDLILSGTRVRGIEGSIRAGPLRLTVVKGENRRAIEGLLDPTDPTQILRQGTYGQDLLAVRPALGGQTFQVGLTALRVRDEISSIGDLRTSAERRANPLPKDNVVAGADATLRLAGGRFLMQYENAISLLANDISAGPLTEPQLDSILDAAGYDPLNIDPSQYEKYFIMNASMIPLDPRGLTSLAQQARTSIRIGTNFLSVEWRSIGGSYYTLGYGALQRDRQGFRIRDSFTILNDAVALSGGYEQDEDNLDDVKPATTTNTGVFATASWQASPQAPAIVASVRQGTRQNDLRAGEDGALDERSLALSFGISYPIQVIAGFRTRLNLNVSAINRDDPANPLVESRDRYYLGGIQGETSDRTSELNLLYGLNQSELLGYENAKTDFHRLVANGRQLIRPRLTALLDLSRTSAKSPEAAEEFGLDYNRTEFLVGGEFEWTPASFITLTGGIVDYSDSRFPTLDTKEVVTRLRVNRSF
ncbi:MAG: hypothetical protein HY701_11940 [Gemmatimonadetes bacterium]|nr:hypothetical protein [Gemmatimonadota bacterium]